MKEYEAKLHTIKCECCGENIACPKCKNIMLRGWAANDRTIALCYDCGSLFWCDNGEIVETMTGDKNTWGASALAMIASLMDKNSE